MTRLTNETVVLFSLIVLVGIFALYRYNFGKPEFKKLLSVSFSNNTYSAELNAKPDLRLNINTASISELNSLPGISSNLAVSIINYREKHPFENVIELARINGIGQKKISVLLDLVRCSEKEK